MSDENRSQFVYVIYVRTTAERLWEALTNPDIIPTYWLGVRAEAQWRAGGAWSLVLADGTLADTGEIQVFEPPRRLVLRWRHQWRPELKDEGDSTCTMELEPVGEAVKLTIVHAIDCRPSALIDAVSGGWPQILSNLKSLLETGDVILRR